MSTSGPDASAPAAPLGRAERYAEPVTVPANLREAVRTELTRIFHPPFETPIVVAMNGALMCSAWFLLPTRWLDFLFSFHGTLAFAAVLASWMYSDVPATNVLGNDPRRSLAAMGDPAALRRLIAAKNLVLWALITPLCAVLAILIGAHERDPLAGLYAVVWIVVVPFGALGISAWVGILFPYHAMPLSVRWQQRRRRWPAVGRWALLVVTPYVLVPGLALVLMVPSLLLWGVLGPHGISRKLPDTDLGWGVAVACAVAALCWLGGHRAGVWMAGRRHAKLTGFLADPLRG